MRVLQLFSNVLVLWVLICAGIAYAFPETFLPLRPWIVVGLAIIMLGMGMTLTTADFARVGTMKRAVACGIVGQFLIMPLIGLGLIKGFRLDPELAMGFVIVGSCPGGTASNVIAALAKADVALSITMTACSTIVAIVMTPLLIQVLGGQYLPVDAWGLLMEVVKIVLAPVALGLILRAVLRARIQPIIDVFPAISVLVIALVVGTIVAASRDKLAETAGIVVFVVMLHNVLGMMLGYTFAWIWRLPESARRTIAIEVGMQNSGLGVALATRHFESALVALPASVFSVVHNVTGSIVAQIWGRSATDMSNPMPGKGFSREPDTLTRG